MPRLNCTLLVEGEEGPVDDFIKRVSRKDAWAGPNYLTFEAHAPLQLQGAKHLAREAWGTQSDADQTRKTVVARGRATFYFQTR